MSCADGLPPKLLTSLNLAGIKATMCGRKRGYSTRAEAKRTAKYVLRKGCPPAHAYHCPFCTRWHLSARSVKSGRAYYYQLHAQVEAYMSALEALDKEDLLDAETENKEAEETK